MQCFHILTEASFSYKISYSYSARVLTVFCLNLLLSKHLFEITILIAFSLLSLNIKNKLQGSTYLLEVLSSKFILLQPYVGWIRMKIYGPTNFPTHRTIDFLQILKANLLCETIVSQPQPAFICSNSAIITVE